MTCQKASAQMVLQAIANHSETECYINLQQDKLRKKIIKVLWHGGQKGEKYHNKLRTATLLNNITCVYGIHKKENDSNLQMKPRNLTSTVILGFQTIHPESRVR